jgi:hypothetical protein
MQLKAFERWRVHCRQDDGVPNAAKRNLNAGAFIAVRMTAFL